MFAVINKTSLPQEDIQQGREEECVPGEIIMKIYPACSLIFPDGASCHR